MWLTGVYQRAVPDTWSRIRRLESHPDVELISVPPDFDGKKPLAYRSRSSRSLTSRG
jgi:hypothetical protein